MKKILVVLITCIFMFSSSACDMWNKDDKKTDSDGKWFENIGKTDDKEKEQPKKNNSEFAVNDKYISYIGKTKAYIDEQCGNSGTYYGEFGLVDYGIGLMVGYNCLGNDMNPQPTDCATSIQVTLSNLFLNCPEVITYDKLTSLFKDTQNSYNEMDMENVIVCKYNEFTICLYPDPGMLRASYATVTTDSYAENSESSSDLYYDFAIKHDSEFWEINKNWRDDRNYYYLADVDHDYQKELVVKLGCGVAVYKDISGEVKQVFYNTLPESSGSVSYWVCQFEGWDYIIYTSASSSQYKTLNVLKDGKLSEFRKSMINNDDNYQIDDRSVFESSYNKYIDAIIYPDGITIEDLK